jgi:4-hydroxybenzoate polyprenyltransferase
MKRLVVYVYSKIAVYIVFGVIWIILAFGFLFSGVAASESYPIWKWSIILYSAVLFASISLFGFGFVQVYDHEFDDINDYPKVLWVGDGQE